MKYLLVFAVLFVGLWLFRKGQREKERDAARKAPPPARPAVGKPQEMLRCANCGVHLPAADAINGPDGVYCSIAHRQVGRKA